AHQVTQLEHEEDGLGVAGGGQLLDVLERAFWQRHGVDVLLVAAPHLFEEGLDHLFAHALLSSSGAFTAERSSSHATMASAVPRFVASGTWWTSQMRSSAETSGS